MASVIARQRRIPGRASMRVARRLARLAERMRDLSIEVDQIGEHFKAAHLRIASTAADAWSREIERKATP